MSLFLHSSFPGPTWAHVLDGGSRFYGLDALLRGGWQT